MSQTAKDLPRGWKEVQSKSRPDKVYFLHVKSGEKTWKLSHVHAKEREFRHRAAAAHADRKKSRPAVGGDSDLESVQAVAEAKAGGIRDKLVACAKANPDEGLIPLRPSIAKRGGDLGPFTRGKMTPSFEEAAFALKVGGLSELVESDSGIHVILRVA
ncbi:hypothetical protein BBJ28_00011880 [Nothophytophthora sp. Chile5]|nr:hypothetical protein BBJ28_00011880 [Nothophytophthora sp. Chile5]